MVLNLYYSYPLWDVNFLWGVDPASQTRNGDSALRLSITALEALTGRAAKG